MRARRLVGAYYRPRIAATRWREKLFGQSRGHTRTSRSATLAWSGNPRTRLCRLLRWRAAAEMLEETPGHSNDKSHFSAEFFRKGLRRRWNEMDGTYKAAASFASAFESVGLQPPFEVRVPILLCDRLVLRFFLLLRLLLRCSFRAGGFASGRMRCSGERGHSPLGYLNVPSQDVHHKLRRAYQREDEQVAFSHTALRSKLPPACSEQQRRLAPSDHSGGERHLEHSPFRVLRFQSHFSADHVAMFSHEAVGDFLNRGRHR